MIIEYWIIVASVLSAIVSITASFLIVRKNNFNLSVLLKDKIDTIFYEIEHDLKPIIDTNSRVMGIVANMGVEQKAMKSAEKALGQDLLEQSGVPLDAVKMAFPNLAEKIEANPELVQRFLPRISEFLANTNFDNLGERKLGSSNSRARAHAEQ